MRVMVRTLLSAGLAAAFVVPVAAVRAEEPAAARPVYPTTAELLAEYRARLKLDAGAAADEVSPEARAAARLDAATRPESLPNIETVSAYQRRSQQKLDESERSWKRITSSVCSGCGTAAPAARSVTVNPAAILARRLPPAEPAVTAQARIAPALAPALAPAVAASAEPGTPGRLARVRPEPAAEAPLVVATGAVPAAKAKTEKPARVAAVARKRHASARHAVVRHRLTRKQIAARAARRARLALLRTARRHKQVARPRLRYVVAAPAIRPAAAKRRFVSLGGTHRAGPLLARSHHLGCTFSFGFLPGFGPRAAACVAAR
ncbi:hypothetical protein [Methylobacterium oxalidis]|uniref:hypothetical protein n=1 Tax=Methylobacterium oxalidis TaxID=944322 RepID=UPI003315DC6E